MRKQILRKQILSMILCLCIVASLMPQVAQAAVTVTKVTVDQLELPKLGAKPDTTAVAVERTNRKISSNVYVDKVQDFEPTRL